MIDDRDRENDLEKYKATRGEHRARNRCRGAGGAVAPYSML
jgi:hypothetical protein